MDNAPINLGNILEQAPHWTLAGDYSLLQWMTQISQDLESRALKTTEALKKLNHNVKSTNIALDNVSNSLSALQFGNQFVECRVQDDDETLNNKIEASDNANTNIVEHKPTSKEMLNTFLNNNLKVLRNCHEKYSIDLDDSYDDTIEGKSKEKTCIYQPINPYNQRPLPYIYGSKDWQANWHVGLYENQQDNSYSGDEMSEEFSESSSTSRLGDNESLESNTEWASSNSVDHENLMANIENRNASSLRGSQQIHPGTSNVPISAAKSNVAINDSSSLSTPSSSYAKKPKQTQKLEEHLSKITEIKNSLESQSFHKVSAEVPSLSKENTLNFRKQPAPFVDLFAEPPEDTLSTTSSSVSLAQNVNDISNETHKPGYKISSNSSEPATLSKHQAAPPVDLFADPSSDKLPSTSSSVSSGLNIKRKTVNLFDDDEIDNVGQNDLLSKEIFAAAKNNENALPTIRTVTDDKSFNIYKTPKSLFEDSDEDDFLREFVNKQATKETSKSTLTKTLLFDNDINESSNVFKQVLNEKTDNKSADVKGKVEDFTATTIKKKEKTPNLFDDIEDEDDDSLFNKTVKRQSTNVKQNDHNATKILVNEEASTNKSANQKDLTLFASKNESETINLFDDIEATEHDLLFGKIIEKDPAKLMKNSIKDNDSKVIKAFEKEAENLQNSLSLFDDLEEDHKSDVSKLNKPKQQTKQLNIFSDPDDDEEEALFSPKPKQTIASSNVSKSALSAIVTTDSKNEQENTKMQKLDIPAKLTVVEETIIESSNENSNVSQSKDVPKINQTYESKDSEAQLKEEIKESCNETNSKSEPVPLKDQSVFENQKHENNEISSVTQSEQITNKSNSLPSGSKYGFNSILFMDEPPEDDNDFFNSLTTTNPTNITNYNAIDFENDLYEPELPKVPAAEINNLTSSPDIKNSKKTYGGLQLFSDIPPDDDNCISVNIGQSKRLQGVFYDDFSETLEALNSNKMPKATLHSIFSNEPPPINNEVNTTDPNKNKVQKIITNEDSNNFSKVENANVETEINTNAASSAKRPVSKLLMPNININVQALLPGANSTSTLIKHIEKTANFKEASNDSLTFAAADNSLDNVAKNEIISDLRAEEKSYSRTAETEHILPNVTRNRVKAPATRRPSTRRARQENIRKTLIEEQNILESDDQFNEIHKGNYIPNESTNQTNVGDRSLVSPLPELNISTTKTNSAILESKIPFYNTNEEIPKKPDDAQTKSPQINEKMEDYSDFSKPIENLVKKTPTLTKTLLFEDESDNDDLFNTIKGLKAAKKEDKFKAIPTELVPEKTCSQITETNEIQKIKNLEVSKEVPQAVIVDRKDLHVDNLDKSNSAIEKSNTTTSPSTAIETKTEISNRTTSSFFDDEDNNNDNFLTSTSIQKSINQAKQIELNRAKSQFKSFLDSDSEEEKKVAGLQTTISKHSVKLSETNNKTNLTTKQKSKQLFADSDTDSDDLFGKLTTTKATNITKLSTESITKSTKPATKPTLFSDESDDDDDDDNFLKTSEKFIKKTISKRSEQDKNKTKIGDKDKTSLFSDIDSDEDDLFGSKATNIKTKATAANIAIASASSKTTTNNPTKQTDTASMDISKTTTTIADYNPLADLL